MSRRKVAYVLELDPDDEADIIRLWCDTEDLAIVAKTFDLPTAAVKDAAYNFWHGFIRSDQQMYHGPQTELWLRAVDNFTNNGQPNPGYKPTKITIRPPRKGYQARAQ